MLQLRIRLVNDDGTLDNTSRVLEALDINYTSALNSAASLDFKVSRKTFEPLQMPFLVRVEYAVQDLDGTVVNDFRPLPEHEIFIIDKDSDDSKDNLEVVTYEAVGYVPWLLTGAYVGTGPGQKDNERTIDSDGQGNSNAGTIMAYFIDESKSRGWLKRLSRNFNSATDSAGVAWTVADRDSIAWRLETFYPTVLEQLTSQSMCDWTAKGSVLNLHRPGTLGVDNSHLVLGGQGFERVPVKSDVSKLYTHVLGLYDNGRTHSHDAAAEARFGRRTMVMSQTGVKDAAASAKLASDLLKEGQVVEREEGYEWTPRAGFLSPFADFNLGDMVTARSRGGKKVRRVIGLIIQQTERSVAAVVQARVGEKISSLAAKNQKKLSSVAVGGVVGGSGGAFPTSPPVNSVEPLAPNALIETSNTASWGPNGAIYTQVGLSWQPVTEGVDGSEVEISTYEIWSRLPSGTLTLDTIVNGLSTSVVVEGWAPEQARLVVVKARSVRGVISAPSLELEVTPSAPGELTPKAPVGANVTSNVGTWTTAGPQANVKVTWAPVTQTTTNEPVTILNYEVWKDGAILAVTEEAEVEFILASNVSADIRIRAKSISGAVGDLSTVLVVIGASPTPVTVIPEAPILKSGYGVLVAEWDGTFVSGDANAILGVQPSYKVDTDTWVPFGPVLTRRGSATYPTNVGDIVTIRFESIDKAGRGSGFSAESSIVIAGIDGADILAGTITGNKIVAGSIEVDQLSPNVGGQLNISANESVQIIVGRQDDQDVTIGDVSTAVSAAEQEARDAATAAADAKAQADVAAGQALVAQHTAQDVGDRFTAHQSVFRVTEFGAEVASRDGSNVLALTPQGMQIIQGGTAASTWDAGRLIVNEAIVGRAQIGNHIIEKSGTARSIFRPI